MPEIDHSVS
ncbi:hypothetical protein E2C01_052645 [Portunus trituberculatus]|uniref:Uncharacterized protein n=1 Tax=Portunus trituberculatus TaxID=210409 RepID=A0A5B7GNT2_PORTR|nr:hypothetical protein [Portunus trituberculatus]